MLRVAPVLWVLVQGVAVAQVGGSAELEQLYLDPAARGSLLVGNGQTLAVGTFRVSAALLYSHGHVKSSSTTLLRDRFALHILGALGVTQWLELSADLPVVIHQVSDSRAFAPSLSGLGTAFIHAKLAILGPTAIVSLWTSLGVGVPIGAAAALGNGGLALMPRLNVGRAFARVQMGAELGGLIRNLGSFADASHPSPASVARGDLVGSQLYLALAASTVGDRVRGEASVRAFASLAGTPGGVEVLLGARTSHQQVEFYFAGGPGFGGTPTTPTFRLYVGAAFGTSAAATSRCTEGAAHPPADCPAVDREPSFKRE